MFSTSSIYFLVAIFGENIESSEAHGLPLVEGQEEETTESGHNEEQEAVEIHNESGESPEQQLEEQEALEQNNNEAEHIEGGEETEETIHQEVSENQRRALESPLSVSAGIGYAAMGLWMILDRRNSKIPYIIAIVGSLILLGIYFTSRTVGISSLGTEPIGLLDAIASGIQVAIIATSLYILIGKIYTKGMTVGNRKR
jgi:hypothetical protein